MYFILTRNKKWNYIKRRNDNYYEFINLSCNVCTMIFFYDIVSRLISSYSLAEMTKDLYLGGGENDNNVMLRTCLGGEGKPPQEETQHKKVDPREAQQREVDPREAQQREVDQREAQQRKVDSREAQQREVDQREAQQKKVDPREAQQREVDPREAQQRKVDSREAQQREVDSREAQQRKVDPREAQQREVDQREAQQKKVDPIDAPIGTPSHQTHYKRLSKKKENKIRKILKVNELMTTLKCKHCNNTDDIWLCLICSNIGCGRYQKSHAKIHSAKYNHHYCINLKTKKIWSYIQDSFIEEKLERQSEQREGARYIFNSDHSDYNNSVYYYADHYINDELHRNINGIQNGVLNNVQHSNEGLFNETIDFVVDTLYDYNSHIYYKIVDIFANDIYISDSLKNELLYILYSQLSYESNIYNNALIELQYKYLNNFEQKKKVVKNVNDKINEIKNQNKEMESFLRSIDKSIKAKNNEKMQIQEKIKFFRDLNSNIITQMKCQMGQAVGSTEQVGKTEGTIGQRRKERKGKEQKGKENNKGEDNDTKKIKRLDETITNLQAQVDNLLKDL
ncbi:ubiquitin carboxyl-terminal hydrolase [Plasmodium brasilianum]|uniref:Ubiquitin carboxyl-terminal hydrolase n=1 Tax=Plasmodium brasilianum TaxID=5824 RepID=A0ACB9YGB6_PLABR|nr:ubiquitin carboxyl-terminal hydrolase [Plasmodium brasilianum]